MTDNEQLFINRMIKDRKSLNGDLQRWFKTGHSKIEMNKNSILLLRIAMYIPSANDFPVISARSQRGLAFSRRQVLNGLACAYERQIIVFLGKESLHNR